ncbi:FAD:protein FMN transferase [Anaerolineae bacterium]|nr:FAD:protein FMN transferase [Anaerolineae bacterium]
MEFTPKNKEGTPGVLRYAAAVAIVLALLAASWLYVNREKESVVYAKTLMGTVVQLTIMEGDAQRFDEAAEAAFNEIARLEAIFSSYRDDSDVSRINASAGKAPVNVHPETVEVMRKALYVATLSGGAFNPAIGALSRLWGPSGEKGVVPGEKEVEKLLPLVDCNYIVLKEHDRKAGLEKEGMAINLGGVAKGYIVDRAVSAMRNAGVTRGIIHAGGDMTVFQKDRGKPFTIGIQDPREKKLLGEAYVYNGAVATSGDYERFFIKDGVRYHHILDPKTGFPARGTRGVTLIAKDPTVADALSTAVFVLGPEKGMSIIEGLDGVEGVIIGEDGKVSVSSGFEGKIY